MVTNWATSRSGAITHMGLNLCKVVLELQSLILIDYKFKYHYWINHIDCKCTVNLKLCTGLPFMRRASNSYRIELDYSLLVGDSLYKIWRVMHCHGKKMQHLHFHSILIYLRPFSQMVDLCKEWTHFTFYDVCYWSINK